MHSEYFVYIMANIRVRNPVLYVGVTRDVWRRSAEHTFSPDGFAARYNVTSLVYVEAFREILHAIAREKQIKGWRREKKIALIRARNPYWHDLRAGDFRGDPSTSSG